mgnify:CR=1 FL=1
MSNFINKRKIIGVLVIISILGTSCSILAAPEPTPVPPTATPRTLALTTTQPEPTTPPVPENLVTSLEEVQQAVIQIESQGTFVDPEFGFQPSFGSGSGFIIAPSGLAVTNNHVVTGAALINVYIGGDHSKTYNARILAVSECSDLAVIDIEGDGFPYLEWYPDPINVGLEIYAAGFPLGEPQYTLTKGIVSKKDAGGESDWSSVNSVIEHDATINPGNSGGPLVNADGQVVGVNYASSTLTTQSYAIGRDAAVPVIDSLSRERNVDTLGVNGLAVVTTDGTLSGIWVSSVKSGSPADEAGIQPGDVITAMENFPLAADGTMGTYCDIIRTQGANSTLEVEVLRYDTNEVLEGQINGRKLAVVSSAQVNANNNPNTNTNTGNTGGNTSSGPAIGGLIVDVYDDGFMNITDEYFALSVDVPYGWDDIDGSLWQDYWGDLYFTAASVTAAPFLIDFNSMYEASGVTFSASRDWGAIGGYIQLLDGVKFWYEDSCEWVEREDYIDQVYEGAYDFWQCGPDAGVVVIGARPSAAPTEYLVLVQIQMISDADVDAMVRIMDTFDVTGYLP